MSHSPSVTRTPSPPLKLRGVAIALGALALGIAVWAVYGAAVHAPFIFDDMATVTENRSIKQLWPLLDRPGSSPLSGPRDGPTASRPVVNLSLALNYHFGQLDPRGYHAVNIALHALSAMLLWLIVWRTLCLGYFQGKFERVAVPLSFVAALVWAWHPLTSESVIYITQRTELMMGLCYLLTLYGSLRYWAARQPAARTAWLMLATLACALGMLSKEMMVSAPVVVLLFERTFIAGSFGRALRQSWPLYLGLALTWIPLLAINLLGPRTPLAGFDQGVPAVTYWLTQSKVLWIYLRLAFWPWPLTIHYEMPWLDSFAAAWPWLVPTIAFVMATLILLWRRAAVGFVGIWMLAILSPTFVVPMPVEVAAERRMYLPLTAIVVLTIVFAYQLVQRASQSLERDTRRRWVGRLAIALPVVGAVALCAIFARATIERVAIYQEELTLWQDAETHDRDDALVQLNLGIWLAKAARLEEALEHFERAVQLKPESFQAHYNYARGLEQAALPLEAIKHYEQTLRLKGDVAAAHNNLGLLLANTGRADEAVMHYKAALQINPDFALAHNNLGIALASAGRADEAIVHFEAALALKHDVEAYSNLSSAYALAGRSADAMAMARKAMELARAQGDTAMAARLEAWLKDYSRRSAPIK